MEHQSQLRSYGSVPERTRSSDSSTHHRPASRNDFNIAIVCALEHESVAVRAMFDEIWERPSYGKAFHDPNSYTPGRIGQHNVVLAYLPGMGGTSTASLTSNFLHSYPLLKLVLVVGICGGVPRGEGGKELSLGDVVISDSIVQYGYARRYPDKLRRKDTLADSLSRPNQEIRGFLHKLKSERKPLLQRTLHSLGALLHEDDYLEWNRPPAETNRLFDSTYRHKHQERGRCSTCDNCTEDRDEVCGIALEASCEQLGCDTRHSYERSSAAPAIHFGKVASADQVLKSAIDRDSIVNDEQVIAFEMEGAGAWENVPTIVMKSVCDYSDSHKHKQWQKYAAAVAACCMKALLDVWTPTDSISHQIAHADHASSAPTAGQTDKYQYSIAFRLEAKAVSKFIGRDDDLARLEKALDPDLQEFQPRRRVFSLSGLGGIGKTQLALAFARKYQRKYSAIIWIDGSTENSLKQSMANILSRLPVQPQESLEQEISDRGDIVQQVLSWLSLPENRRWLLIFDNVDRDFQASNRDELAYDVEKYFPWADHGSILITTRLDNLSRLGQGRKVKEVTIQESLQILQLNLGYSISADDGDIQKILQKLQGLPLALTLAGSYMKDTGMSPSNYNQRYERTWQTLMAQQDRYPLREYDHKILATWRISYEKVQLENDDSAKLLEVWAFLANNDLSYTLLDPQKAQRKYEKLPRWLMRLMQEPCAFDAVVQPLLRYSLINSVNGMSRYSMHPIFHDWCFELAKTKPLEQLVAVCNAAAILVVVQTPLSDMVPDFWTVCRSLLPHAAQIYRRVKQCSAAETEYLCWDNLDYNVLDVLGMILANSDNYPEAEDLYRQALERSKALFGLKNEVTFSMMRNLSICYRQQNKLKAAEKTCQEALPGLIEKYGPKGEPTMRTKLTLGTIYLEEAALEQAEEIFKQIFTLREESLGESHPETLVTAVWLAQVCIAQKKLDEAETILNRILSVREKSLGREHKSTLECLGSLGEVYYEQGKLEEAEKTCKHVVSGYEKALGQDHAVTLGTLHNLATVYESRGDLDNAEKTYERALSGLEKTIGYDHVITLDTLSYLADVYRWQGELDKAEKTSDRVLVGREKALGYEHESTLSTVNNLGFFYREQGKLEEAEKMFERGLSGREEALGHDHADTLDTVLFLGSVYLRQGELYKAEKMFNRTLSGLEKDSRRGPKSVSRLGMMTILGYNFEKQGKLDDAERVYNRTLAGYEKVYGRSHDEAQGVIHDLSRLTKLRR